MHDVGEHARGAQVGAALARFVAALVGEVDVDPTGEQVLEVPGALAVAQQHEA